MVRKVRAALIISILRSRTSSRPRDGRPPIPVVFATSRDFSTLGQFDLIEVFAKLGILAALLTIFAIMLSDFFDTMGTATGDRRAGGLTDEDGRSRASRRPARRLRRCGGRRRGGHQLEHELHRERGGRRRGRADRASRRWSPASCSSLAIFLAPLAGTRPVRGDGPALVLVGFLMFTCSGTSTSPTSRRAVPGAARADPHAAHVQHHRRHRRRVHHLGAHQGRPRQGAEVHPLMWIVAIAFVVYFAPGPGSTATCRSSA